MRFIYFIEESSRRALAFENGDAPELQKILRCPACSFVSNADYTPTGKPGLFVCEDGHNVAGRLRYDKNKQEWQRWGTCTVNNKQCDVHVGVWLDWIPGPADLARELNDQIAGLVVNGWNVPLLMVPVGDGNAKSNLPVKYAEDSDGNIVAKPMRKWRELCEKAEALWKSVNYERNAQIARINEDQIPEKPACYLDADAQVRVFIQAIGINYRVTAAELELLELLNSRTLSSFVYALIGLELKPIIEEQKKTEEGDGNSEKQPHGQVA